MKRLEAYYSDKQPSLEQKIKGETRRLQKEISEFKATLRFDEPKPLQKEGLNEDLKEMEEGVEVEEKDIPDGGDS